VLISGLRLETQIQRKNYEYSKLYLQGFLLSFVIFHSLEWQFPTPMQVSSFQTAWHF